MSIVKPWNFEAGKKARANEVNDDFDLLYSQVNTNISAIEQNSTDIDNLDLNKANIDGDSTKVFNVADATSNTNAINKQTMMRSIGNIIDYINGLTIEVDTNSPTDTILVNPGSCYDSTHREVLVLNNITSKQNLNQGASTTYYVYIVKNNSTTEIVLSQSSIGEGITGLFRQIGYYTTNGDSEIYQIYSSSNSDKITTSQSFGSNGYCKLSNGLIIQWGRNGGMGNNTEITVTLPTAFTTLNYSISGCASYAQSGGDKRSSWYAYPNSTSNFKLGSRFEQYGGNTIYWTAIGY